MGQLEQDDFYQSKRIYAEAMVELLDREGGDTAKKRLAELFADETLSLFPEKLDRHSLYFTIINLTKEQMLYRDSKLNRKQ